VWNVPPRNPNFTGRAADLARIRSWLAEQPAVTVHALHGMGGVGKTQAAVEYAYRYADEYDLVWWINSERVTVIDDQFARLAEEIGLPQLADPEAMPGAARAGPVAADLRQRREPRAPAPAAARRGRACADHYPAQRVPVPRWRP
jgi:hypothetical protein